MRIPSILLLCLTSLMHGAIPTVEYWTDEARTGWLGLLCRTQESNRLSLIPPNGIVELDLISKPGPGNEKNMSLHKLRNPTLPASTWWHRYGAVKEIAGSKTAFSWQQDGHSALLQAEQSNAHGVPPQGLHLQALARSVQLGTEDPLVQAFGLEFSSASNTPLAQALHQHFRRIHRSHDQDMREWEVSENFTDRPAEMVHELRLLDWSPVRCTALALTRSKRLYAKTSVVEESIHLRRTDDGQWISYDPLAGTVDKDKLRESIRVLLNQQQASGDHFAERYPDPLQARGIYIPLRIGNRLYLRFAPYTVAAGAWGTVTIAPARYAPDSLSNETAD